MIRHRVASHMWICLALAVLAALPLTAQDSSDTESGRSNVLTFGFGSGGIIGAEYERTLIRDEALYVNANLGASWLLLGGTFSQGLTAGFGRTHAIEAGVSGTLIVFRSIVLGILGPGSDELGITYRLRPMIGYRRQPPEGGLVIRVYFSPYLTNDSTLNVNDNTQDFSVEAWGGLLFGFSF